MKTRRAPRKSTLEVDMHSPEGKRTDNFTRVDTKNVVVWFSYKTPIAYRDDVDGLVVSENYWGVTTGKHLNWVDGGDKEAKKKRKKSTDFEMMYHNMAERHQL